MSYLLPRLDLVTNSVSTTITVGTSPTGPTYVTGDIPQSDNIITVRRSDDIKTSPTLAATVQSTSTAQNLSGVTLNLPEGGTSAQSYTDLANQNYTYDSNLNTQLLIGHGVDSSSTTIADLGPNAYSVTATTGASASSASPYTNSQFNCFSFPGNAFLTVPDNAVYYIVPTTTSITFEAWFYPTSHPATAYFASQTSVTSTYPWAMYFVNGKPTWSACAVAGTVVFTASSATTLSLNTWTHVAWVYEASANRFVVYINGVREVLATNAVAMFNSTDPLRIGASTTTASAGVNFYNGYIGDIRSTKSATTYSDNFTVPTHNILASYPIANPYGGSNTAAMTGSAGANYCNLLISAVGGINNVVIDTGPLNQTITNTNVTPSYIANSNRTLATTYNSLSFNYNINWTNGASATSLQFPHHTGLDLSTGTPNWCVEGWIYWSGQKPTGPFAGQSNTIFEKDAGAGYTTVSYGVSIDQAGIVKGNIGQTNIALQSIGLLPMPINTWTHIAFCRKGTVITLYVNGIASESATITVTMTDQGYVSSLGSMNSTPYQGGGYFQGYISNFRIVKGNNVYSGISTTSPNFSLPTQPFTAAQAGNGRNGVTGTQTAYLLGFVGTSATICDLSVWAATGVAQPNLPTPITDIPPNLTFPTSTYAYNSVYLNGSGYLGFLSGKGFQLGQEEFTVEFWFYQDVLASAVLVDNYVTSAFKGVWQIWSSTATGVLQFLSYDSTATASSITSAVNGYAAKSWNHVALVRRKTFAIGVNQFTITLYVNGASVGTVVNNSYLGIDTIATAPTLARGATVGRQTSDGTLPFTGYISDLRIIKQAIYTNNFAPSTSQLQLITQTPPTPSYGVLSFNGVNQYLGVPAATGTAMDLATGSPDWTIECWLYLNNTDASYGIFVKDGTAGTKNGSITLNIQAGGGQQLIMGNGAGSGPITNTAQVIRPKRWTHIAAVRTSTAMTLYVNGIAGTAVTPITMFNDNNPFYIGCYYDPSPRIIFPGYIANFRVVKGTALYSGTSTTTANFTLPPLGTPLANVANTVLLLNVPSETDKFLDSSASNLKVTGSASYTAIYDFNTVNITTTPINVINSGNVIYTKTSTTSSTTTARYEPLNIKSEYAVNYSNSSTGFSEVYRSEVADVTINSYNTVNDSSRQVLAANINIPVKNGVEFFINGTDAVNNAARDPNFRDVRIRPVTNLTDPRRVDTNRPLFDQLGITGETPIDQQTWIS